MRELSAFEISFLGVFGMHIITNIIGVGIGGSMGQPPPPRPQ